MEYKRNIRVHDQRERGAGGFVVFYTVHDIPGGEQSYAGRVGMDLFTMPQALAAQNVLKQIPDAEWNYKHAWDTGMREATAIAATGR